MTTLSSLKKEGSRIVSVLFEMIVLIGFYVVALPLMAINHIMYWLSKAFHLLSGKAQKDYFKLCADIGESHQGKGCVFIVSNHLVSFVKMTEKPNCSDNSATPAQETPCSGV